MPNIAAENREGSRPVWDMSQERAFMENLLNQRVNFFLIFFSLVIAGSVSSRSQMHLSIVLSIGGVVCWLLSLPIFRAQQKLDIALNELFKDVTHPAKVLDDSAKGSSRRKVIGYVVPVVCSAILTVGAILAILGCLTVAVTK